MSGFPDFNYPYFARIQSSLVAMGYRVKSPHQVSGNEVPDEGYSEEKPYGWYLSRAIEMQLQTNCWVGLPGWCDSTGAFREFHLAKDLGHELVLLLDNESPTDMGLIQMRARKLV